ncbi:MAG TPA: ankyrin repeat domain-containing protein [Steroidobacteraceae bacterium]|jgi:ankyrin repeat protein
MRVAAPSLHTVAAAVVLALGAAFAARAADTAPPPATTVPGSNLVASVGTPPAVEVAPKPTIAPTPVEPTLVRLAEKGNHAGAMAELQRGTDVRARDVDGTTALHWAAHFGDADLAKALIAKGADAKARNDYGSTPMMAAAETGSAPVIEALIKGGADVESPNREGQTALMAVARTGNLEAAKALLKHGANPNARETWSGQTALMWAAAQSQPKMVRLLLDHGANVNESAMARDWQRRVTAEPRPKDMHHGGFTALLFAARESCIECAKELLRNKADPNLVDPDGVTPLIEALLNIHWDFAKFMIQSGADVNQWDMYGRTPLYAAVDMNTLPKGRRVELPALDTTSGMEIINMLLDRGANANAQLKLRAPHRQIAYDRYTEPLLNIGATPLLRAAKAGDIPAVKALLAHGAIPDLANINGDTPLMAAVGKGWINAPTRGAYYTEEQALQVYALLRAAGADVNAKTNFNETPLHSAALRGWNEIVQKLVADGAKLDAEDRRGLTPLDFAMGRIPKEFNAINAEPKTETFALLKTLGAKVEHPNLPPWPAASTPRITAWVPSDTNLAPPF